MLHHGGNGLAVSSPDYSIKSKTEALNSDCKRMCGIW